MRVKNYEFNTEIKINDITLYDGKPIAMCKPKMYTYIFTVVSKTQGEFKGKYLMSTMSFGKEKAKESIKMNNSGDIHAEVKFTSPQTTKLRTLTVEEYKLYKTILRKQITYDNWI